MSGHFRNHGVRQFPAKKRQSSISSIPVTRRDQRTRCPRISVDMLLSTSRRPRAPETRAVARSPANSLRKRESLMQINCAHCLPGRRGVSVVLRAPRKDRDGAVPRHIGALRPARVCVQFAEAPAKNINSRGGAKHRPPQFFHSRQHGWPSLLALLTARRWINHGRHAWFAG